MKQEIKKIGTVQPLDKKGNIINNLSLDNIQIAYSPVISDTLAFYKNTFGDNIHSIYLRGSVAKGKAVLHISDLDTFAISHQKVTEEELKNRLPFWEEMDAKYDFLKGVEIFIQSYDELMSSDRLQFLLSTQCICIQGKDLREEVPKFGIGKWAYAHSNNIQEGLDSIKSWLEEENTEEDFKEICTWIMKRTVRIGFEIVMEKEQCFTRDLYPCYEMFAKHYIIQSFCNIIAIWK